MGLTRLESLKRRHTRIRRKVRGAEARPRLCVHKSLKHLYVQLIDDQGKRTIMSLTTNTKANKSEGKSFCNVAWAKKLGAEIARRASEKGLQQIVFDRGGYPYHGIVKALAEAAREGGLKF